MKGGNYMNNDINLSTFPSSTLEALAMLYTKNQDLKGKSATEIAKIYYHAYHEIHTNIRDIRNKANQQ